MQKYLVSNFREDPYNGGWTARLCISKENCSIGGTRLTNPTILSIHECMEGLWHKNAIVYTIDLQSFADGNADGIGDFLGLAGRLDYLSGLNVNCLWLQPFFPSPQRDHGYDISDYYGIDPRYGTLGDFVEFSEAARDRGIRIIVDLVVNHTSIDHPWFQAARRDPKSKYRNWYVWSKDKPPNAEEGMVFPGVQRATFDS